MIGDDYERLRAAADDAFGEPAWGLVLFVRSGFVGWALAIAAMQEQVPARDIVVEGGCGVPAGVQSAVVSVLAHLVLTHYRRAI